MSLQYCESDLIDWFDKIPLNVAITQQLNCFCKQCSGLALEISRKFPSFYDIDCKFSYPGDINKLGHFIYLELPCNKFVTGIYSQYNYGRTGVYTLYDKLEYALIKLTEFLISRDVKFLGIPYNIGCGLGGGNWEIVKTILERLYLNKFDKEINCFIIKKKIL